MLIAASAYVGQHLTLQSGLSRLRETAEHRLDMLATGLDADLARLTESRSFPSEGVSSNAGTTGVISSSAGR